MSERKLATVRRIDTLDPIEGADKIEVANIGGWKVVCQKGLYTPGDLAMYFEIDSWIPNEVATFLTKPGQYPKVYEGIEGQRLKTIKLRGQISQGLLIPLSEIAKFGPEEGFGFHTEVSWEEGSDWTEALGIKKWEKPIPACLSGISRGSFPSLIPKTDQERVQNLTKYLPKYIGSSFEVTEKLEGSSMTCYVLNGEFGVCSRNLNLLQDENNAFWKVALRDNIGEKMLARQYDFAIQGELVGPGIQGNIYKLSDLEFYVFDIYDPKDGEYMSPHNRRVLVESLGLKHVPVLDECFFLEEGDTIDSLLKDAEGKSKLYGTEREGIVFKQEYGDFTFKAISNNYLLKSGE